MMFQSTTSMKIILTFSPIPPARPRAEGGPMVSQSTDGIKIVMKIHLRTLTGTVKRYNP